MKLKKPLTAVISVAAAAAVIAAGFGGYQIYKNANTRVDVCSISLLSPSYWGDNSNSYGFATTDMTQDVYLTDKQVVKEIFVKEGDIVSVGTPLMALDNTMASLDLEMQALSIDNIDIQIDAVEREIRLLENATLRQPSAEDVDITLKANTYQLLSSPGKGTADPNVIVDRLDKETILFRKDGTKNIYTVKASPETILTPEFLYRIQGIDMASGKKINDPIIVFVQIPSIGKRLYLDGYTFQIPEDFHEMTLDEFMHTYNVLISDIESELESESNPFNGLTAEERNRQLKEKQNQRKTLDLDRREAVLKYEKMRKDVSNGTICSTVNGEVKTVGNPDTGIDTTLPFITVTSQDGFYLKGSVNELQMDQIEIGQEISITNMETGMMTSAKITSISDFPVSDNAMSYGVNPNTSNYPFTAHISDATGFKNNQSVNINFASANAQTGGAVYLPISYIREDSGESYVFIADAQGRLKKQPIETGVILYGYYQEIRSGLTLEDLIAFPYGKSVREGVKTNETDTPPMY